MALPESTESPRVLRLRQIVQATESEEVLKWPHPNESDMALFGRIIVMYSGIDFALRFVVEIMDDNKMLLKPWAGKASGLTIAKVSQAIQSSAVWSEPNKFAWGRIDKHRALRNLVAHFAVRRFPTEDAYYFMTKSSSDFQRVYGVRPDLESVLYGVMDAAQLRGVIPELEQLLAWCSKLPGNLSRPVEPPRS